MEVWCVVRLGVEAPAWHEHEQCAHQQEEAWHPHAKLTSHSWQKIERQAVAAAALSLPVLHSWDAAGTVPH